MLMDFLETPLMCFICSLQNRLYPVLKSYTEKIMNIQKFVDIAPLVDKDESGKFYMAPVKTTKKSVELMTNTVKVMMFRQINGYIDVSSSKSNLHCILFKRL